LIDNKGSDVAKIRNEATVWGRLGEGRKRMAEGGRRRLTWRLEYWELTADWTVPKSGTKPPFGGQAVSGGERWSVTAHLSTTQAFQGLTNSAAERYSQSEVRKQKSESETLIVLTSTF